MCQNMTIFAFYTNASLHIFSRFKIFQQNSITYKYLRKGESSKCLHNILRSLDFSIFKIGGFESWITMF